MGCNQSQDRLLIQDLINTNQQLIKRELILQHKICELHTPLSQVD